MPFARLGETPADVSQHSPPTAPASQNTSSPPPKPIEKEGAFVSSGFEVCLKHKEFCLGGSEIEDKIKQKQVLKHKEFCLEGFEIEDKTKRKRHRQSL